MLLRTRTRVNP